MGFWPWCTCCDTQFNWFKVTVANDGRINSTFAWTQLSITSDFLALLEAHSDYDENSDSITKGVAVLTNFTSTADYGDYFAFVAHAVDGSTVYASVQIRNKSNGRIAYEKAFTYTGTAGQMTPLFSLSNDLIGLLRNDGVTTYKHSFTLDGAFSEATSDTGTFTNQIPGFPSATDLYVLRPLPNISQIDLSDTGNVFASTTARPSSGSGFLNFPLSPYFAVFQSTDFLRIYDLRDGTTGTTLGRYPGGAQVNHYANSDGTPMFSSGPAYRYTGSWQLLTQPSDYAGFDQVTPAGESELPESSISNLVNDKLIKVASVNGHDVYTTAITPNQVVVVGTSVSSVISGTAVGRVAIPSADGVIFGVSSTMRIRGGWVLNDPE